MACRPFSSPAAPSSSSKSDVTIDAIVKPDTERSENDHVSTD
jgi:hypothetical protein